MYQIRYKGWTLNAYALLTGVSWATVGSAWLSC